MDVYAVEVRRPFDKGAGEMIQYVRGDLLADPAMALVNTVNCVGVMGAGIAAQFKRRYPWMFKEYQRRCRMGSVRPGHLDLHYDVGREQWLVNFPTKRHWRDASRLSDIRAGLASLRDWLLANPQVRSIAIPALGCQNGRLSWAEVQPEIESALGDLDGVDITAYEPMG